MKKSAKRIFVPIFIAALLFTALNILPVHGEGEIYGKVIRLHVIAASDSERDQALKLTVRDAILDYVSSLSDGCETKEQAEQRISEALDEIREKAEAALREQGCHDSVSVSVGKEDYPTREYDNMRFPAGEYTSLRVMIGNAEGQNWWCVLFPPLCVGVASKPDDTLLQTGFTPNQVKVLTETESPTYRLRFRFLEWLQDIF